MLRSEDFLIREMIDKGLASPADVDRARSEHPNGDVAAALVSSGVVESRDVALARAVVCETPFVDLERYDVTLQNAELLPRGVAEAHTAFPLFVFDRGAVIGMADPLDFRGLDQIRQRLSRDVEAVHCEPELLRELISRAYRRLQDAETGEESFDATSDVDVDDPVVATVNDIITSAILDGASDIHLGPDEGKVHLRYRIDGVLQVRQAPARSMHDAIVRRLKVMAKLDLTQTRKPLDGKIAYPHHGETVDLRVSVIPTIWGENVVIRVLRRAVELKDFSSLGMNNTLAWALGETIGRPHGMILVTGPTGSGKTTTLYTALSMLNTPERNVMTIEDPVEVRLPMIRQTQVNTETGLTFATALRSILRQDPDVVLVGEIRDRETAQIAVQSALTGHLVLSTLHTNDASGAVARLRDFEVPPFAISSALLGVLAQRLVRKVCDVCAQPAKHEPDELRMYGLSGADAEKLRSGVGCPACGGTGYRGRLGVYEYLRVSSRVRSLIARDASPIELATAAREEGLQPMWRDAAAKATAGLTTLTEAGRVRADDPADTLAESGAAA
jgi:type II secretory ATPase GspE/PulE/Tfp pilus assembly ATPase PilB-like protein